MQTRHLYFLLLFVLATFALLASIYHFPSLSLSRTWFFPPSDPNLDLELSPYPSSSPNQTLPTPSPQIIIVQHAHGNDSIQTKSLANHKRYAKAHGYKYHAEWTQYIGGKHNWNAKTLNKAYTIMGVMLRELALGEQGAEWML